MNEGAVKKQQRIFMRYNFVVFTIIFALFGFIIYSVVRVSLFAPVDENLRSSMQGIQENSRLIEAQLNFRFWDLQKQEPREQSPNTPYGGLPAEEPPEQGGRGRGAALSMRVQIIIRDADGTVLNPHTLGRLYFEDILDAIPYSNAQPESISSFQLADGSHYRSIGFVAQASETDYYIQLVVNTDGEQAIIDQFVTILVIFVAVFTLLSIAASYLLSRKSMQPLMNAWNRQTEFVENASHELRTPLTIIQNKLEGMFTAPQATVLDRADDIAVSLSETRRLTKLTSDLMTLARADSSETQLAKESFDLDSMIGAVCEPYAELAGMQEKTMRVEPGCKGEILADPARVHELMVILLDNALKYTHTGDEIVVRTSRREGGVCIEVADSGIGISEESRARVFDRFYREDKARSRKYGGSGLGLSIAKWIVDSHGGELRVLPGEPKGTVMQVLLK